MLSSFSTFQARHASSHDLVNKKEVRSNHCTAVDHLTFDPVIVVYSFVLRYYHLPRITVNSYTGIYSSFLQNLRNYHNTICICLNSKSCTSLNCFKELFEGNVSSYFKSSRSRNDTTILNSIFDSP